MYTYHKSQVMLLLLLLDPGPIIMVLSLPHDWYRELGMCHDSGQYDMVNQLRTLLRFSSFSKGGSGS